MKITCYFFASIILKYVSVKYSAVLDVKLKHEHVSKWEFLWNETVNNRTDFKVISIHNLVNVGWLFSFLFFSFLFFFFEQELKSLLEELSFQKGELNVQISEKKNQLSLIKQEIEKEEENLQVVLGQMSKHKTGKFKV